LNSRRPNYALFGILGLFIVIPVVTGWLTYQIANHYPGGSHFLTAWSGSRTFLTEGVSPYSEETFTQTRSLTAGWPERPSESTLRFTYPLYSLLFFLPFALFENYVLARALWMTALGITMLLMIWSGMRLAGWSPRTPVFIFLALFILFGVYSIIPLLSGNFAIVTALLITLAFAAIKGGMDELAGFLLALSTIMFHLVIVLLVFVIIWSISNQRWGLIVWLFGSLGLLAAGMSMFLRDWLIQYGNAVLQYYDLENIATPGHALRAWWPGLGSQMGWVLTAALLLVLGIEWWQALGKGFRWFLWTACLTLVVGQLIGIRTEPGSLVVLLLPMILVFSILDEQWGSRKWGLLSMLLVLLFGGFWILVLRNVDHVFYSPAPPVLFFNLPFVMLIGLYWIRWRAARPQRFYLNEMRAREEI
jgi:hypothetical protein